MAHRAYPSRERALRQLDRHQHVTSEPELTPLQASAREALIAIGEVAGPIMEGIRRVIPAAHEGRVRG